MIRCVSIRDGGNASPAICNRQGIAAKNRRQCRCLSGRPSSTLGDGHGSNRSDEAGGSG